MERFLDKRNPGLLKKLTIVLPLVFLTIYYYLMLKPAHELFHSLPGFLLLTGILGILVYVFATGVFGIIQRQQETILFQNEELAEMGRRLRDLYQGATILAAEVELSEVQRKTVELGRKLFRTGMAALVMVDLKGNCLETIVAGPGGVNRYDGAHQDLKALLEQVIAAGKTVDAGVLLEDDAVIGSRFGSIRRPATGLPLRYKKNMVGVLLFIGPNSDRFSDNDRDLQHLFVSQAAIALENARLYQEIQALATETERVRIGREMHDSVAQVLAYVNAKAQAVDELLNRRRLIPARQQLEQLIEASRRVFDDIREGILALRVQVTPERNLFTVLDEYVKQFVSQSGVETSLVRPDVTPLLGPVEEIQLLRIVQEALTNVRRHSKAKWAEVRFEELGESLRIVIADNGCGIKRDASIRSDRPHFGLEIMRERAEAIGGTFNIEDNPGGGTRIVVNLPVTGRAASNEERV